MTTLREAAQQALEALEFLSLDFMMLDLISPGREAGYKAITALRAALAEMKPCNKSYAPGYCYCECPHGVTDGNCKECYGKATNSARAIERAHGIGDSNG